jgi:hypothetical protein
MSSKNNRLNRKRNRLKFHTVGTFAPRTDHDVYCVLTKKFQENILLTKMFLDRSLDKYIVGKDKTLYSFYDQKSIFVVTLTHDGHLAQFAGYVDELDEPDFIRSMGQHHQQFKAEIMEFFNKSDAPKPFTYEISPDYLDDIAIITRPDADDGQNRTQI